MDVNKDCFVILCMDCSKSWKDVSIVYNLNKDQIRRRVKKFGIHTHKKFFWDGSSVGRQKGFKHSDDWKHMMSVRMNGDANPFFGKTHSQETLLLMSENHADFTGDKNPYKKSLDIDPNKRVAASSRAKNMWVKIKSDDPVYKKRCEKMSKHMASSTYTRDSKYHKNHLSGHIVLEKSITGEIFYRSSYELFFATRLSMCNKVKTFDLEPFIVKFESCGKIKYTRIDFFIEFIDGSKAIVEVKPSRLISANIEKISAMQQYATTNSLKFAVFTENNMSDVLFESFISTLTD